MSEPATAPPLRPPAEGGLKAGSVDDVLQKIAAEMAARWGAFLCGLLLFNDASKRLVLRGCVGCPDELRGRWHIHAGDGLAGAAFAEGVPLHSADVAREVGHVPVEQFFGQDADAPCAEVAVPVLRGEEGVGVVLLLRWKEPFRPEEINGLRADVARHAGTLEMAKALYMAAARDESDGRRASDARSRRTVRGTAVTPRAVAFGVSSVVSRERAGDLFAAFRDRRRTPPPPVRTFDEGVDYTIRQLERYQEQIGERLPEAARLLFDAQIMILRDETFTGRVRKAVAEGDDIAHALCDAALEFTAFFRGSGVEYLAEKAQDMEDVAFRLLGNIYGAEAHESLAGEDSGRILLLGECFPSDIFRFAHGGVRGIVLIGTGSTAHVTLLVKSLGIPAILAEDAELLRLPDGVPLVLNGPTGEILVNPDKDVVRHVEEAVRKTRGVGAPGGRARPETLTRDGARVHLLANVNLLSEAGSAVAANAEGVGLYRTEFPFLLHPALPNEEDQVELYGKLLDAVPDRPVTIRTLDVGGDKVLSYFQSTREENPALGLRSTRFTLRYPYIFDQQLRAIFRAVQLRHRADVSIMFPMIGSVEEFDAAVRRVDYCLETLGTRYALDGPVARPAIGTMVELPALVHLADAMARRAAFFSIGTNDFIQYMLAVDRANAAVRRYYIPHHPAVLHGIARVASAGVRAGIPVSVCGEMGHDPRFLPFFLGLGIRHFSLDPDRIAEVQEAVSRISLDEASRITARLLTCETVSDVERILGRPADDGAAAQPSP